MKKLIIVSAIIGGIILGICFFNIYDKEVNYQVSYIEAIEESNSGGYDGYTITNIFDLEQEFSFDDVLKLQDVLQKYLNENKIISEKEVEIISYEKEKNIIVLKIGKGDEYFFIQASFTEHEILLNELK